MGKAGSTGNTRQLPGGFSRDKMQRRVWHMEESWTPWACANVPTSTSWKTTGRMPSHSNKAHETVADRHSKSAERKLTNPLLLRRYARLQEQAGAARETTNRRQPPLLAAFRE